MSVESDNLTSGGRGLLSNLLRHNDAMFAVGLATVLATLLIPLPTFLLDLLLAASIAVAIATLVTVLSAREAIEFSSFPSLLLFVTLFRLSLNVASTRLILSEGDAGDIIHTFGTFIIGSGSGGSGAVPLVIGLVVFLILVIIQFVVITKGSERISEVAARFNLDAMPGKQMAIDADLNAGLIGEEDARQRREKIVHESEFYGAMDGASKFIRGDAIAGLIITGINLVGGFIIGMSQGMNPGQSIGEYSVLSIGDGLVSQIPAVIISTASGFLISKSSSKDSISEDLVKQLTRRSRPLYIASGLMGAMVLVPGFPKLPFIVMSAGAAILGRTLSRAETAAAAKPDKPKASDADGPPVEELLDVDKLSIQVGARLIRVVDPRRQSSLSHRIGPLRRKFAQQMGVVLPLIRLRDNVLLEPNEYEIRINGHAVANGKLEPHMLLAMDSGAVTRPIKGQAAREPVFNLPALWVDEDKKTQAEVAGYTVVDPESVLITHLSETLRRHAHELLGRDDVQQLVDRLRERQPTLVNTVMSEAVTVGLLQRVLQNLLADSIPIRDLAQVLESLGDHATRTKDPATLTELARKALVRTITEQHLDSDGQIRALVLEPSLEGELRGAMAKEGEIAISGQRMMDIARRVSDAWQAAMEQGHDKVVLLCDARLRAHLAGVLSRQLPQLPVVAYDEVTLGTRIQSVGMVALEGELAGATT
jgi:flagellar biosynthesis protein FlhA